jgi:arylsulfatase A-like enzyme
MLIMRFLSLAILFAIASPALAADKPNVLFIAIDDLRDWVGFLGDKHAKTPNLDRLAARGVAFTRSYCAAPVCNPSRTALLTGLRPGSSGVYGNGTDWRTVLPDVVTLPQHFKSNGYEVRGAGKIYHGAFPRMTDWDEFVPNGGEGKIKKKAVTSDAKDDGVGGIKFKPLNATDADIPDHPIVNYAIKQLQAKHEKPFFLACGIHKPHMPWNVPQKYYDMYPLDKIELPPIKEKDLDDVPPAGIRMAKPDGDHAEMLKSGRWKEAIQAYRAAISYMDTEVGRLIDAFDKSAYKHWRKFALWEESTRSPMFFIVPGVTKPGKCDRTVDYMSLYPTLCDLCAVPIPKHVQGSSFKPLLADPTAKWETPAITTHGRNNHGVRTERWRYIHYANGDEELYDHDADPHEWTNLAKDDKHAATKKELAKWLPMENKADPEGKKKK